MVLWNNETMYTYTASAAMPRSTRVLHSFQLWMDVFKRFFPCFFCWFLYICIKLELNTKTMCVWLSLLFSSSIVYLVLIDFNSVTKLRVRMKYKTLTHLWRIVYNEMHLPSCVFYCLLNSFNNCLTHLRCTFSDEHPTYYLDT